MHTKEHFEEVAAFIREHRSNESNFETLYQKLNEEATAEGPDETYRTAVTEAKEKAAAYAKAKEAGGTTWPEFENFTSDFEKAVIAALKNAQ
ncbi:MAG TPA: hypothetical protein VM871_03635 [Flavisolibacter sp.]|nr:hypothetical protein [Flavisolibacter sp.]